jgi:hypothetical protein
VKGLRIIFIFLLCIMLPMSGLAASGLAGQCPMQASMANGDSDAFSAEMADCDAMKTTSAPDKTKRPLCKVTAQCQMGSLYHPFSTPTMHRPAGLVSRVAFHYTQSLIVHTLGGLWRPPRAL